MMVSNFNKVLGQPIHTQRLNVGVLEAYISNTLQLLRPFHLKRKSFMVKEIETMTDMLYIATLVYWVKFLLFDVYTPIAVVIGDSTAYLCRTNKQFHKFIKEACLLLEPTCNSTFA